MNRTIGTSATVLLILLALATPGFTQSAPPSILEIDVENIVNYGDDISNASLFATNPGIPPRGLVRNFAMAIVLGDIVAVNGQPAKGTFVKPVPCMRSWAMIALLSFFFDRWQSVQLLVSLRPGRLACS